MKDITPKLLNTDHNVLLHRTIQMKHLPSNAPFTLQAACPPVRSFLSGEPPPDHPILSDLFTLQVVGH